MKKYTQNIFISCVKISFMVPFVFLLSVGLEILQTERYCTNFVKSLSNPYEKMKKKKSAFSSQFQILTLFLAKTS